MNWWNSSDLLDAVVQVCSAVIAVYALWEFISDELEYRRAESKPYVPVWKRYGKLGLAILGIAVCVLSWRSQQLGKRDDQELRAKLLQTTNSLEEARNRIETYKHRADETAKLAEHLGRQVNIVRDMTVTLTLFARKQPNVADAVIMQLPVRKTLALATKNRKLVVHFHADEARVWDEPSILRHITALYVPKEASTILGKPIDYLRSFSFFAFDISEILQISNLQMDTPATLVLALRINGVQVALIRHTAFDLQKAARGEISLPVAREMANIPERYDMAPEQALVPQT